jgi:hypothetical protein
MEAISYSYADKQAKRIKKFIENPDSTSGVVTVPSTIATGETITVPAGRTAILPDVMVEGDLVIDGTVFIPSGSTFGDLESQIALKAPIDSPIFTGNASVKNVNYKSTPVIITSWSYSGTTITLNVASHTFVAGDYIEVSGLTSTTYPANGIHLVTSVTSTTIVFTLSATPTGTAGVSSATVKGYVTINGRILTGNKTYQDLASGKIMNVAYINTSGESIDIVITFGSNAASVLYGYLNGIVVWRLTIIAGGIGTYAISVPNGANYGVGASGGTGAIISWYEAK